MNFLFVFLVGILRIVQANINKQTSSYMDSTRRYLSYGAYFEGAAALFSVLYLCISGFYGFNAATVVCSTLTGTCFLVELLTSLAALQGAPLVLCNMCALGGGIILPSIAGIFFFDEPMTILQWTGVVAFFAAVYFLSPNDKSSVKKLNVKTIIMLALNFFINGCCGVLGKYFAVRVENGNPALFSCLSYVCASVFFFIGYLILSSRGGCKTESGGFPKKLYPYGMGLGAVCATIVYFTTALSRVIPIVILNTVPSVISIIGCLLVGRMLFFEKITAKNICGVISGIISAILIVNF